MLLRLKLWLGAVGIFAAALAASWFGGKRKAQTNAKIREVNEYVETRKRLDTIEPTSDPAAAREWLQRRGEQ